MGGAGGAMGGAGGGPAMESPLLPRVENETCRLPEPPPLGNMRVSPAFDLVFDRPLWLGTAGDGSGRLYVVEQSGRILVFEPGAEEAQVFLQRSVSRNGNEEGLLGLAFHPNYAANGRFFVYYSAANPRRSVISEYARSAENPLAADPDSEELVMEVEQPFGNHNGGDIHFGPDGYLYISLGDGGAANDPQGHGQNLETLLSSILRIDIDRGDAVCLTRYGIPEDNPFAAERCIGGDPRRPEIWAWGLRNVWRMSFDRSTGELWAGDVGQDAWEIVHKIEGGKNYGWNTVEGEACFLEPNCDRSALEPPIHVYDHGEGRSITGGYVYRGADLPELWGAYVFGDYVSGRIWAYKEGQVTLLADTPNRIASFGEDRDGRLYVVTFDAGILRLGRRAAPVDAEPFPERLSQTGCFADTAAHTWAPGVLPYGVQVPLWSDAAVKVRALALPAGASMGYQAVDAFDLPEGTILLKSFELEGRRLETRLLRKGADAWRGFVYKWTEDQTDAVLLRGAEEEVVEGPGGEQTWQYPSRPQCDNCHSPETGYALGITALQLNGPYDYPEGRYNQLAALAEAGYLELPGPIGELPAFPDPADAEAEIESIARAILDANCAMCHREEGLANADIDLRAGTPFADTGLCDELPEQGDLGIDDARLLAPGDPNRSILLQRMLRRGEEQMPPIASTITDTRGTAAIGTWIQTMAGCP